MISRQTFSDTTAQQPRNEKKKTRAPHESMTQMEAAYRSFPMITVRKFLSTAIHIPIPMRTQPHIYRHSTSLFIYSLFLIILKNSAFLHSYFSAFTNHHSLMMKHQSFIRGFYSAPSRETTQKRYRLQPKRAAFRQL